MTVTQKGTGSVYNILIILDSIFQLLQTDKKRKPRVCVVPKHQNTPKGDFLDKGKSDY